MVYVLILTDSISPANGHILIQRITITDFQSIKSADLSLGLVTVVTGPSNSGKSAVFRAFRAALTNPKGSSWVREGSARARVSVRDAYEVVYEKTAKGTPSYHTPAGAHTALGASATPDEVDEFFNMDPEVQTSDQFDPPFLVTLPANRVAATLAALSQATLLGQAVSGLKAKRREAESEIKVLTRQQGELQAELEVLEPYLEEIKATWDGLTARMVEYSARHNRLTTAQRAAAGIQASAGHTRRLRQAQKHMAEALPRFQAAVNALVARSELLRDKREAAAHLEAQCEYLVKAIERKQHEIHEAANELIELWEATTECPFCGQAFGGEQIAHDVHERIFQQPR